MSATFNIEPLFRTLIDQDKIFRSVRTDLRTHLLKILEKALKTKNFLLEDLVEMHANLGAREFDQCVDALSSATCKAVVKKLDPHNEACKGAAAKIDVAWARKRLRELGAGEPAEEKIIALDKALPAAERTPENLAAILNGLGADRFAASLAAMSPTAPRSFVKKLDPQNPKVKGPVGKIDSAWARRRIAEIAGNPSLAVAETRTMPSKSKPKNTKPEGEIWAKEMMDTFAPRHEAS